MHLYDYSSRYACGCGAPFFRYLHKVVKQNVNESASHCFQMQKAFLLRNRMNRIGSFNRIRVNQPEGVGSFSQGKKVPHFKRFDLESILPNFHFSGFPIFDLKLESL